MHFAQLKINLDFLNIFSSSSTQILSLEFDFKFEIAALLWTLQKLFEKKGKTLTFICFVINQFFQAVCSNLHSNFGKIFETVFNDTAICICNQTLWELELHPQALLNSKNLFFFRNYFLS